MYDSKDDDWVNEVGRAVVGMLRALTSAMPLILSFYAAGLLVNMVLSGPFELTCKSTMKPKHRAEAVRLLPEPKASAPAMQEPVIKAEDE